MARFHRILDPKTNEITVVPFTAEEELVADEVANRPPPTDAERIDKAFPGTDVARVLLNVFTDFENRLRALEGKQSVTKSQVKNALQNMLN